VERVVLNGLANERGAAGRISSPSATLLPSSSEKPIHREQMAVRRSKSCCRLG